MTQKHPTAILRETLSATVEQELANLPALLADLTPKERLTFVCKILPYVMAKKEPVQLMDGWGED